MVPTAIPQGYQGLGWFLRRTTDPLKLAEFYVSALGLPRLRSWDVPETTGVMLWCGDVGVLELNRISSDITFTPEKSPCTPIFRSRNFGASCERALIAGARSLSGSSDERGETCLFSDPDGFRFGIERVDVNLLDTDLYAQHRWEQGSICLPGGIGIDGDIQDLSRVLHYTDDRDAEMAFLQAIGFEKVADGKISLSGGCFVDLQIRQKALRAPTDRSMAFDTWIARVYGLEDFSRALSQSEGRFLSRHEFKGGTLDYALSPSNVVVGWQERKPYDPDLPTTQMIEDLNARTQWIEKLSWSNASICSG